MLRKRADEMAASKEIREAGRETIARFVQTFLASGEPVRVIYPDEAGGHDVYPMDL